MLGDSHDVDSSALGELFTAHGTVESSQIITDRDTGQSKGFGFVEMGSDSEAQAAIAAVNGQEHSCRTCDGRVWSGYPNTGRTIDMPSGCGALEPRQRDLQNRRPGSHYFSR